MNNDNVNHPKHYTSHPSGIECIEITRHHCFSIGNAIKYLWRAGLKDDSSLSSKEKEIEDLEKAIWYINDRLNYITHLPETNSIIRYTQHPSKYCIVDITGCFVLSIAKALENLFLTGLSSDQYVDVKTEQYCLYRAIENISERIKTLKTKN